MPGIRQVTDEVVDANETTGEVVARISTKARDSFGTTFEPMGWEFDDPFRGPIDYNHGGMMDHGLTDPWHKMRVAKPLKVWREQDALMAHYQYFVDAPAPKLAEFARALAYIERESGMDHSIVFDPLSWMDSNGRGGERALGDALPNPLNLRGRNFTRQRLVGFGPVGYGSNADAQTIAARAFEKFGVDIGVTPPGGQMRLDLSASADGSGAAHHNEFAVAFGAALQKLNQELETRRFFKAVAGGLKNE